MAGYVGFIDLQKAHDSVDRELLWQVLTRFGLPAKMPSYSPVPRRHAGVRACVRTDDGEHSEPFDVTQRLRQSCRLSPLLFSVFSAAAIRVVLARFSGDEYVVGGFDPPDVCHSRAD